jgi:hypothetical protein
MLMAAGSTGCADPEGQFEEFSAGYANRPPPPAADCGEDKVRSVEGTFFAAFSTQLDPKSPVVFLAEVSSDTNGLSIDLQPLRADDRHTPVGDGFALPAAAIGAEGAFSVQADDVLVPAEADPILPAAIEMTVLGVEGTVCENVMCGGWWGPVTAPIETELTADLSKFAMVRVEGTDYPEPPPINCNGDLAGGLE